MSHLNGRDYWRSLDELAGNPDADAHLVPEHAHQLGDALDRRRFLSLMAASIGLAGASGCRRPEIPILAYTRPPEDVIPGLPTYYATAMPRPGGYFPLLAESHEGRPTKLEGNPLVAASGGAADAFAQASILSMYDPDRALGVANKGADSSWDTFDDFSTRHFAELRKAGGAGLRFLAEDLDSPSMDLLRKHIKETLPEAHWHTYEPIDDANSREGATLAFGSAVVPRCHLEKAAIILTLDADILGVEDCGVDYVRGFGAARSPGREDKKPIVRLYAVEPAYTATGGMADHRLRLPAGQVVGYALALAKELIPGLGGDGGAPAGVDDRWVKEVAADLKAHRGSGVVVAGRRQPAVVHALTHQINAALGNLGSTITLGPPAEVRGEPMPELADAIRASKVDTLVILGGNPAYNAPADLDFPRLMKSVPTTIRLGMHRDETSALSTWHVPESHYLESWGDGRTADGTLVAVQPQIEPLFGGKSALEVVAKLIGYPTTAPFEIVRRAFRGIVGNAEDVEDDWRRFLHEGHHPGTTRADVTARFDLVPLGRAIAKLSPPALPSADALELIFARDVSVDDGRYANNGWLQEAPDPITKLCWDNAALLSPATAAALKVNDGNLVTLAVGGRSLEIAAMVAPGHADNCVTVALGYGRTVGRVADGAGFDAYKLRTTKHPDIAPGVTLSKTGRTYPLATTQSHNKLEGDAAQKRELVQIRNVADFAAQTHQGEHAADIQTRPALIASPQWGMAIDLNTCVGCTACLVACQAENNVPIVGKDEVRRGREMHWLRIDRYFAGDQAEPELLTQAVMCVHCENAPCELVCPVNAAVHSEEGLNLQVYNRCVGTRYCSNNCPYKVRRFNWFNYNERPLDQLRLGPLTEKGMAETLKMQKNPEVTVRIRGVMEKCTYCIQRIEAGKIGARVAAGQNSNIRVPDGTITPACAQTCPTKSIVFGDVSDPDSRVSKIKSQDRDYALLGELNTKPRTTYQARLRNPNPRMAVEGVKA